MSVPTPLPIPLALAFLLAAAPARAQPASCREPTERPVELDTERCGRPPEIRVGEGVATVLRFDTPLVRTEASGPGRYRQVVDGELLILVPEEPVADESRTTLTVYFADDAVPTQATLQLVVATPARAERQVELFRRARTAASLQRELRETQRTLQELREENARLKAAQARPDGLMGLWVSGDMGRTGIAAREFLDVRKHARNSLVLRSALTFRARSMLVVVGLKNPLGAKPWQATGAALVGPDGAELKVARVWAPAILNPGDEMDVLVKTEPVEGAPRGPFTLTLWAEDGKRPIILGNIEFP
ncbi:hypothetical protein BHS09_21590 [Myxococcus xanthus]|uniref:DUF2381 family protein n=1 Tax=Myxococcus xanthus TaxID=34 RepID=A0AAE6G1W1_MYXXA|nr:hypothetical protein BHS09_21590 [Myxococcus xanthus]QDE76640.1 hypothetical protein BHS08_21605 [Myxococcus xanthus]